MAQGSSLTQEDNDVLEQTASSSWLNPFTWIRSWRYSSMAALALAERRILASLWDRLERKFVPVSNGTKVLRTIGLNTESDGLPLVLVHGMGAGVGFWILNLEALANNNRPVYAFDVLGFGRSSRPTFSKDPLLAELEFVESMEDWRKGMNLDKFILLGHSLGGFISASYAIRYPERVRHLILVDAWGFPEKPTDKEGHVPIPIWIRAIARVLQPFNPLAVLRAAGPWGPDLVTKFRSDITRKFGHLFEDDTIPQYIYHCNAQTPSGENAFKHMTIPFGWARYPMIKRITELPRTLPMTVIYGSRSWVDSGAGFEIKYLRNESYVDVQVVKGAGHHVYADKAYQFNSLVSRVCQMVDNRMDFGQPFLQATRRRSRVSESNSAPLRKDGRRYHSESMPSFSKVHQDDTTNWENSYHGPQSGDTLEETSDDLHVHPDDVDTQPKDEASGDTQEHNSNKVKFSIGKETIQENKT